MKTKLTSRIICYMLAIMLCFTSFPLFNAEAATVITENKTGTEDGYAYELWKDNGNTSMTLTGDGTFSCEWNNINNCLFRKGKKYDCTQTYQELGNISIKYGVDYQPNGNSYMCVYGWTRNPLVEYYIVETWGSWRPPGATESLGQVNVNGGTYDIYKTVRENQPSIDGNTTFDQYWSVRTSKPASNGTKIEGVISVSEHFKAWEKVGLKMGKMYEVALNIEGYQSSGKATVYTNELSVGGELIPDIPVKPVEPDDNGYYFNDTFESSVGNWTSRGDTTTAQSSSAAASGSNCLSVTGRTDAWNGTGNSINSAAFQAGNSYSFSTMVMQNSVPSDDFKLSLQYDLNGETHYDSVAEATGVNGEWVQLTNTNFTIPEGAANLLLYVETKDSTTSFFIDDAIGAVAGTEIPATGSSSIITPSVITGDADNNGTFDIKDIVLIQQYLAGKKVDIDLKASDADENGKVNIFDLCILKNMIRNNNQ